MRRILALTAVLLVAGMASATWWITRDSGPDLSEVLMVAPDRISFGTIPAGSQEDQTVIATNLSDAPIVIEKIRSARPFSASRTGLALAPGASAEIVVSFAPQQLGEQPAGQLIFESASLGRHVGLTMAGTAGGPAELSLDPVGLSFGEVAVGGRAKGLLTIRNRGGFDLEIDSMSVPRPFSIEMAAATIPPGGSTSVEIAYLPEKAGDHRAALMIRSNDHKSPQYTASVRGRATLDGPDVAISVDVEAIDFGTVAVGGVSERWITISNRGSDALNITSVTIPSPFAGSGKSRRIPVGKKLRLPVSFSPREKGSRLEPLIIHSNDPSAGFTIVSLLGQGADAAPHGGDPIDPGSVVRNEAGSERSWRGGRDAGRAPGSGGPSGADDSSAPRGPGYASESPQAPSSIGRFASTEAPAAGQLKSNESTVGDAPTVREPELVNDDSAPPPAPNDSDDSDTDSGDVALAKAPSVDPRSGPAIGTHMAPGVQVGDIQFDSTTGQLTLSTVRLPTIELPFNDFVEFDVVDTVSGVVTPFGEFETEIPIRAEGRDGVVYEGTIALKTGDQVVFTKSGPRSISGEALTDGAMNIVGQIVVPPGPTAHNTETLTVRIGLDNLGAPGSN